MDTKDSKIYELPPELWNIVMEHFHSCYKKPLHYQAIMGCKHFTRRRGINIDWNLSPIANRNKHSVFDSFYIWIVLNNWIYWEFGDTTLKPDLTMVRKSAQGNVKQEFEQIWNEYAVHSNEDNLLSRIHY
jgi:hypothetical protein